MSKVVDITEQLNFEENPKIKIGKKEYEVNADATSMLKVMQLLGDVANITPKDIVSVYEVLFSKEERDKIDKLKLKFEDFTTLVMSAIEVVTGEKQGE